MGTFDLTECPLDYVGQEVWDAIEMAELYEKGLPPVAGGSLDQCRSFLAACRMVWADQRRWKAELEIR